MSHATIQSQWEKSEYIEPIILHTFLLKAYQFPTHPLPPKMFLFRLDITLSKRNYIRKMLAKHLRGYFLLADSCIPPHYLCQVHKWTDAKKKTTLVSLSVSCNQGENLSCPSMLEHTLSLWEHRVSFPTGKKRILEEESLAGERHLKVYPRQWMNITIWHSLYCTEWVPSTGNLDFYLVGQPKKGICLSCFHQK